MIDLLLDLVRYTLYFVEGVFFLYVGVRVASAAYFWSKRQHLEIMVRNLGVEDEQKVSR